MCKTQECRYEFDREKGIYTDYGEGVITDYHIGRYVELDQEGKIVRDERIGDKRLVFVSVLKDEKLYR